MTERSERQAQERKDWIAEAVGYLFSIEAVDEGEILYSGTAYDLAESLWYYVRDEGGEMMYTPKEAVDEEMTYWGD
jgi:hypothetical protein